MTDPPCPTFKTIHLSTVFKVKPEKQSIEVAFAAGVTNLQFPIKVCLFLHVAAYGFLSFALSLSVEKGTFSSTDIEL